MEVLNSDKGDAECTLQPLTNQQVDQSCEIHGKQNSQWRFFSFSAKKAYICRYVKLMNA